MSCCCGSGDAGEREARLGAFPVSGDPVGPSTAEGTTTSTAVASITRAAPQAQSIPRTSSGENDNEEDSDLKAVQYMRNRSSTKQQVASPVAPPAVSAPAVSGWADENQHQDTPSSLPLSSTGSPAMPPSPPEQPQYSMGSDEGNGVELSPLTEAAFSEDIEMDEEYVDLISKERYVAAVKLLHRNLIEKEKAMTDQEREFLQDLLYSAIHVHTPTVDQLSAVESATETLDKDPLFLEEAMNFPPSPTKALQLKTPPRPFAARPTVTSDQLADLLAKSMETSDGFETDGVEKDEMEVGSEIIREESFPSSLEDVPSQESDVMRYDGWSDLEGSESGLFRILGSSPEDQPRVLTPLVMEALRGFLPSSISEENFWLKFSLVRHGSSLQALLYHVRASSSTVIAVETIAGDVFGSFTSTSWRKRKGWFGSGEAFLWRLKHSRIAPPQEIAKKSNFDNEMKVYPFTGHDDMVQFCTGTTLAVGGGDWESDDPYGGEPKGIGFMLDGDLEGGESSSCATFASPRLCQNTGSGIEFDIQNLEVWTLTPCLTIEEAQNLELRKMFMEENRL